MSYVSSNSSNNNSNKSSSSSNNSNNEPSYVVAGSVKYISSSLDNKFFNTVDTFNKDSPYPLK